MKHTEIFKQLKGHLIVSCQALEDEPLHSSYIMSALCGFSGGTFPDRLIYNRHCGTVHDAHASDFHCLANLAAPQPLQA